MLWDICEILTNIHQPIKWEIAQQRWTKLPLKSMVNFIFLKFGMVELFQALQLYQVWKWIYFNEITFLLFKIYSFVKFKVLVSFPKSVHGLHDYDNALQLAHWPFYWS